MIARFAVDRAFRLRAKGIGMNMRDWFYQRTTGLGIYSDEAEQENASERFAQYLYSNRGRAELWGRLSGVERVGLLNNFLGTDTPATVGQDEQADLLRDFAHHLCDRVDVDRDEVFGVLRRFRALLQRQSPVRNGHFATTDEINTSFDLATQELPCFPGGRDCKPEGNYDPMVRFATELAPLIKQLATLVEDAAMPF